MSESPAAPDHDVDPQLLAELLTLDSPSPATEQHATVAPDTPFALTDIQAAYLTGRDPALPLGGVACQFYYELACDSLDTQAYVAAWHRVVNRHGMLRARFDRATSTQFIRPAPDQLDVAIHDLRALDREQRNAALAATRDRLARDMRPADRSPLMDLEISLLPEARAQVHLGFDLIATDQHSILILLDEAARFYRDPDLELPVPNLSFGDYRKMAAASGTDRRARDRGYWERRAPTLPPAPDLPYTQAPDSSAPPSYDRVTTQLGPDLWQALQATARKADVTASCLLLDSFGQILRRRAGGHHFCLNMTQFDRQPLHADVDHLVGDFTTNMLFEMNLSDTHQPRRARLQALQAALWRDLEHTGISGIETAAMMARAQGHLDRPLMPVVFTSTLTQNDRTLLQDATAQPGRPVAMLSQTPQVTLDNQVLEWDGALRINWDFAANLLPRDMVASMLAEYECLLRHLADTPDALEHSTEAEFDDPTSNMIVPQLTGVETFSRLTDLWLSRLPQVGERPAILTADACLNHRDLAAQVAGIANQLADDGIGPGDRVAILLDKSPLQIAAALAVSIVGAAWVPVDAAQPDARRQDILRDLSPRLVLDDGQFAHLGAAHPLLDITALPKALPETLTRHRGAAPGDLAYVIYTSGSTGRPKGVMISHAAAMNTINDIRSRFGITETDRVLALSELHFDLSVQDIFGTLGGGGALVLPEATGRNDPSHWAQLCARHAVTLWNSVPGLFDLYVDYLGLQGRTPAHPLTTVLVSGDWVGLSLRDRAQKLWPTLRFHALGGATEASIWSNSFTVEEVPSDWPSIPYGRGLGGQQLFVLTPELALAAPGQSGDIHIAGAGLAMGYWQDQEKTAAQFFDHPRSGLRLYRTGDIGMRDASGLIWFQGRADAQIKVNGYRIETGEIIQALQSHADVADAVILADTGPEPGTRGHSLTGCVRLHGDAQRDTTQMQSRLTAHLSARLPAFMIPARWLFLPQFPLTANGKTDRKVLSALVHDSTRQPAAAVEAPPPRAANRDFDATVCAMVADVLKRPAVVKTDNLLDLGATSLELIALASRIQALSGTRPALTQLARAVALPELIELVRALMPDDAGSSLSVARSPQQPPIWPEESRLRGWLSAHEQIDDPHARRAFKSARDGLRSRALPTTGRTLDLPYPPPPRRALRSSCRDYADTQMTVAQLAMLLAPLRRCYRGDQPSFAYASAGGLYPVELHLLVPEQRIAGLAGGVWAFDPCTQNLRQIATEPPPDLGQLGAGNSDWLGDAHLLMFFVLDLDAIAPLYDSTALPFAMVEVGAMAQLMETSVQDGTLGVCQTGGLSPGRVRSLLHLSDNRLFLHGIAAGVLTETARTARASALVTPTADLNEGFL